MKVSLNWIRLMNTNYGTSNSSELTDVDKLIDKIGSQLGAVEEVIKLGERYKGILVIEVVSCVKHPNADKLSLCLVDDGGANKTVKRDDNNLIQVVCGAPNVRTGQLAVWIPPGATVPVSFDKEPFVIESRPIRNKTSHGMLASPKELALGDNHEGIMVLDSGRPGDSFAKNLQLDDVVIDIENKMFTHRPDCFGILGVARELAGISHKAFKSPDWYKENASLPIDGRKNVLKLSIKNQLPDMVPRFCAVAIKNIKVGPSPIWLQSFLIRSGVRPINNIVDITNWFMLATAQPLHAYDYDKVKTGVLGTRMSKTGETLKLLNGKTIKFDQPAVVITDGHKPISLAGVMGGADTEVDECTMNIILECANFDMNTIRRTAMAYGLFTDAATRFTKNQSPRQNLPVLVKTAHDLLELAGGRLASPLIDDIHFKAKKQTVKVSVGFVNDRLGLKLSPSEIKKLLQNVEFEVNGNHDLVVTVPFWRTDIEIPEDIVEEVGRLFGYDKLPITLPKKDLTPATKDVGTEFKTKLRNIMASAGTNEVLTYSFVPERLIETAGQDSSEAFHIRNAVSPELQYYRLGLVPSLLEKIHPNQKAGFDVFGLFEIGKFHLKGRLDQTGLPIENEVLSLVAVNPYTKGAAYYQAVAIAEYLFGRLNITDIEYLPLTDVEKTTKTTWMNSFEPSRSAVVCSGDKMLGIIGEPNLNLRTTLKLPASTSMFELDIPNLYEAQQELIYRMLNRFPSLTQDICLRLPATIKYGQADRFVWDELDKISVKDGYRYDIETLDIFERTKDASHYQITWRISLSQPNRTLTTDESNKILDELSTKAKTKLKAERI